MKKKICAITMVLLLILSQGTIYADTSETLLEYRPYAKGDGKVVEVSLINSDNATKFVAHAKDKTYITYGQKSEMTMEENFYLGYVNKGEVVEIGDIDSLTGEGSTNSNYWVTGMVQCKGEVFLSKPNGLYKLRDNKLQRIKLTVDGQPFDLAKYRVDIGGLSTDTEKLYIHLRVPRVIVTANSDNVLKVPLDTAVLSVTMNGEVDDTGYHLQKHYPNKTPSFTMMADKLFFVFSDSNAMGSKNFLGIHIKGDTQRKVTYFITGELKPLDCRVISYGDRMFTYARPWYKDEVVVSEIKVGHYYAKRNNSIIAGVYETTSKEITRISDVHYISGWSIGDDGYLYMVTEVGSSSNTNVRIGYSVYRLKL